MKTKLKPYDIKKRSLGASGRYCDFPECHAQATELVTYWQVAFFGVTRPKARRLCSCHAADVASLEAKS